MKYVVRLKSIDEIDEFNQYPIDVFVVDGEYSIKKIAFFTLDEIKSITEKASECGKEVFVNVNKMIHETDLERLKEYLNELRLIGISGIVCNDLTVYVLAKKIGITDRIIYQPGTMNTDSFSTDYFAGRNILGITLSREITLDEIKAIASTPKCGLSLVGHGYLDMFYSKRTLLKNYFIHKQIEGQNIIDNHSFRLNEEIRPDQLYPILEDEFGTYVFRSKKLISINEVDILENIIEYFFIERIFISDEEHLDTLALYHGALSKNDFLNRYPDYDSGFYYKRTEKLKGDLDES